MFVWSVHNSLDNSKIMCKIGWHIYAHLEILRENLFYEKRPVWVKNNP